MKKYPDISITRLAIYLRFLEEHVEEKGVNSTISSGELARSLSINPHQIRKDLSYFGKFGQRGKGYKAQELREQIATILGLRKNWNLCLCGLGNLGSALFAYQGFKQMNLNIAAVFDNDPQKINKKIKGVKVYNPLEIPRVAKLLKIDIAIIAVPTQAAQEIANRLVKAGVRAILNFAPIKLTVPSQVKLRNVDLSTELINLTFFLINL